MLSKARARFGLPVYQAAFTEVVRQCERAGLVRGDVLYVDSTLVKANASLGSAGARALLTQLPSAGTSRRCGRRIPSPIPRRQPPPGEGEQPAPDSAGGLTAARGARPSLHVAGPEDVPNGDQGPVNALVTSRTDPDAGLVKREVPYAFYYKAHVGVDGGRARLITALDVTPGEVADEHLLDRLLKEHRGTTGRTVAEVVADTKYDLRQLRGAGAAGHPGEHPAPQHHERPG